MTISIEVAFDLLSFATEKIKARDQTIEQLEKTHSEIIDALAVATCNPRDTIAPVRAIQTLVDERNTANAKESAAWSEVAKIRRELDNIHDAKTDDAPRLELKLVKSPQCDDTAHHCDYCVLRALGGESCPTTHMRLACIATENGERREGHWHWEIQS